MMSKRETQVWDTLVEYGVATEAELGLACALCGVTEQTLNSVLYIRTGYRTIEQMMSESDEEE